MLRLNDLTGHTKARVLRVFPGFIFCVLISTFIIGPLFSTMSPTDYFSNDAAYSHLVAVTTLAFLSPFLPEVFESNPYGAFINGSLWTLKYEVICYFALAFLWKLGLIQRSRAFAAAAACVLLYISSNNEHLINLTKLSLYFFSGALFYLYRDKIVLNYKALLISAVALMGFNYLGLLDLASAVFGGYIISRLGCKLHKAW